MRRIFVLIALLTLMAAPAWARPGTGVVVGETALDIRGQSVVAGKIVPFSLRHALGERAVVLYFFPKAFTKG